jgi:transcriptional regulator with XRE-family HTH domain
LTEECKKNIAKRLKEVRKIHKLNAADMADRLGVNARTYGAYERSEITIGLELIIALRDNFHTDPLWFIFGETRRDQDLAKIIEKLEKIEAKMN